MGQTGRLDPSDASWREAVAGASEFLTLIDEDFRLAFINKVQPGLDDLVGADVFLFVDPAYHDVLRTSVRRAQDTRMPQHYASQAVGPNGKTSTYSNWVISLHATDDAASALTAIVGIDTTHLGRVEEELAANEKLLRALMQDAPDLINIVDAERRILFSNKTLTGRPVESVIGARLDEFMQPPSLHDMRAAVEHVFATGEASSYETTFPTPRGDVALATRIGPIFHGDAVENVLLITTDVTEERRAEQERQRLAEQLFHSQKLESLGKLTGGIAHDFNNLLSVILGGVELIHTCIDDPDEVAELASDVKMAASRAAHLTQRLLAFARRQSLTPRPLDLNHLLHQERPILDRTLGEQVAVEARLASDLWPCRADPSQLQNAVLNLAINARDAMAGRGQLVFTTTNLTVDEGGAVPPGEWVRLAVADNGSGMSAEVLQRAIEPFFTTKAQSGSGLGLSMVYGFMTQSGGHFVLESTEGVGTTAALYLPRYEGDDRPAEVLESDDLPLGSDQLVLVVEDDPRVLRTTEAMVRSLGYRTVLAADPAVALEMLAAEPVELVFSDVVLPRMSGAELRWAILDGHPDVAVVLTSGFAGQALSDPRDAELEVLPKPFTRSELAKALSHALKA